jgi:hypothetical protein
MVDQMIDPNLFTASFVLELMDLVTVNFALVHLANYKNLSSNPYHSKFDRLHLRKLQFSTIPLKDHFLNLLLCERGKLRIIFFEPR